MASSDERAATSMADDVKALFRKINQSHLPYQVFEPPPIEEAAEAASRRAPAAPARPPEPPEPRKTSPTDFLRAYADRPAPPAASPGAPIRLKELFERLASRG